MTFFTTLLVGSAILGAGTCGPTAAPIDSRDDTFSGDSRLNRRLSISIEGMAVSDVLALLSEKSGVALTASRAAADDKLAAFSPPRSLREILNDIAALFNDHWERHEDNSGNPRYLLTRSAAAIRFEDELFRRPIDRMLARLEEQVHALAESPEDLNRRAEDDPIRKELSKPDNRLATDLYGRLSFQQKQQLLSIGRLRVPLSSLPASYRQSLREVTARSVRASLPTDEFDSDTIDSFVSRDLDRLEATGLLFKITRYPPRSDSTVWLSLGKSGWAGIGKLPESGEWQLPPHGNPYVRTSGRDLATVPESESNRFDLPASKIARVANEPTLVDALKSLSNTSGLPVLADYYRSKLHPHHRFPDNLPDKDETIQAINDLANRDGRLWWSKGRTLFFRARDWFERKRYEVPDHWYKAVVAKIQSQHGKLTYDDLQRFAELTPRQIHGLMTGHRPSGDLMFVSEFDLFFQPGLHELLELLKPKPWPFKKGEAIVDHRLPNDEQDRATLTWDKMTPMQRNLIPWFVSAQDDLMPSASPETFTVFITRRQVGEVQGKFASVGIVCSMQQDSSKQDKLGGDRAEFDLFFPLVLPDDRRDKTRIIVSPDE